MRLRWSVELVRISPTRVTVLAYLLIMPNTDFTLINRKYVFPVQFMIGCIGNVLNLIVLNSRGMRTKTNCFLSAMAVADLGFFFTMFPICVLSTYDIRSYSEYHNLFFLHSHIPLLAFANWFSAASIWLSLGVTVERLIAIKFPLLARTYWKKCRIIMFIVFVYVMALVFSLYHFAWRTVIREIDVISPNDSNDSTSSGIRVSYRWTTPDENATLRYWYVHISHGFAATTVILLPLITLIVLSSYLVYYLRLNTYAVRGLRAGSVLLKRGERRVTSTVVVLIAAFTMFNLPSGIYAVIMIGLSSEEKTQLKWYFDMAEVVNSLVCMNKAINFGLYCSASSGFRRQLVALITRHRLCGRVVRTLSNRFSVSSYGDPCPTNSYKYSFMTTVFHDTRDNRYHSQERLALQRRTQSIDTNHARPRTASSSLQLQQIQYWQHQQGTPHRERTCSAL